MSPMLLNNSANHSNNKMAKKISQDEEDKIYKIISDSLYSLCKEKPSDPIFFLSQKMLENIGEDMDKLDIKLIKRGTKDKKLTMNLEYLQPKSFRQIYRIIRGLGSGKYGSVYLAELRSDNSYKYAVKIVKKNNSLSLSEYSRDLLTSLDHPNLIDIKEIIEEDQYIYIVNEYCEHGDLSRYVLKNSLDTQVIKEISRQLFSAITYLHEKKIVHGEIKPENILFHQIEDGNINIKLADFGSPIFLRPTRDEDTFNNIYFMAPETIINNSHVDFPSDVWSAGIVMYTLFCGIPPFYSDSYSELLYKILSCEVTFSKGLPEEAEDLIRKALIKNPSDRELADKCLDHEYFADDVSDGDKIVMMEALNQMQRFVKGKNLRHIVLSYITRHKLYKEQNFEMIKLFQEADVNHDGLIDHNELFAKYGKFFPGTPEDEMETVKSLIEKLDINGNGKIDYSEFMMVCGQTQKSNNEKILKEIFDIFDIDKNGYIDIHDLKVILKEEKLTVEHLEEMIGEFDSNYDGKIEFYEFLNLVSKYY